LASGGSTASFSEVERIALGSGADSSDATAATGGVNVDAGAGNDTLTGGSGADTLAGGAGGGRIDAGAGNDTIPLGAGDGVADGLALDDGDGSDTVYDFAAPTANGDGSFTGHDLLDVTDLTDAEGNPVNTRDVTVT